MSIDCHELRSFLVLAEQLHFGRSANLLHISQPALSKQIKALEGEIGGPLLTRNRREVKLTPAGAVVHKEGRRILRDLQCLLESAQAAVHGEAGTLRIAVGIATIHSLVPPALRKFREAHPRVEIQVEDMSTPRQTEALLEGQADVGFLRLPVNHSQLIVRKVLRERLTIAASSRIRGPLTMKSLSSHPFILIGRGVSATFHDHCIQVCRSAGFTPRVVQEAQDMFTLLSLVRAGIGVALVPQSAKQMRVKGVRFGAIPGREAEWDVGVAWNRFHETALVRNFVQICVERSAG